MSISIHFLSLDREKLHATPLAERKLFFVLGHIANELSFLNRIFFWCAHSEVSDEHVFHREMSSAQALMAARLLVGKLSEAMEVIKQHYLSTEVGKIYANEMPEPGKRALRELNGYFGRKNIITDIRNNFSFHHPTDLIAETSESLPEQEELRFYLSMDNSNDLYGASDLVVNYQMLEMIVPNDRKAAFERVIEETSHITRQLIAFIQNFMIAFMSRHALISRDEFMRNSIRLGSVVAMEDVRIPTAVDSSSLRN